MFRGQYQFQEAWGKVAGASPAEGYEIVTARHSRLGDLTAAVEGTGTTTTALSPGDTLTLAYARTATTSEGAADWFLVVGVVEAVAPAAGGRVSLSEAESIPAAFALHASRPNPFSRHTTIQLALPRESAVRLVIFDLLGRRVRTLADRSFPAGEHAVPWDGRDEAGGTVPPGVYKCRMEAGEFRASRTMVLLP